MPNSDTSTAAMLVASIEKLEVRVTAKLDSLIDAVSSHNSRITSVETQLKAMGENASRFWSQTWPDLMRDNKAVEERLRIVESRTENLGTKLAIYAALGAAAVSTAVSIALKAFHVGA